MSLKTASDQSSKLRVYERFQRWRRRESIRWPGLFRQSMSPPIKKSTLPKTKIPCTNKTKMTVEKLRNGRFQIVINSFPIVICDGCGALLPLEPNTSSSASTISPQSASKTSDKSCLVIKCETCSFLTPLGPIRRLLALPSCGPEHDIQFALSLLIEAVGIQLSMRYRDPDLHSWFLDRSCRISGLDALFGAIGIREEQLFDSDLHASQSVVQPTQQIPTHYVREADQFLKNNIPKDELPSLPFTIDELLADSQDNEQADDASAVVERASALVTETLRIWNKPPTSEMVNMKNLLKIKAMGREYSLALTKVRMLNHSQRPPQNIQHAIRDIQQPSKT